MGFPLWLHTRLSSCGFQHFYRARVCFADSSFHTILLGVLKFPGYVIWCLLETICRHCIFKHLISSVPFLFPFWYSKNVYTRKFDVVPQLLEAVIWSTTSRQLSVRAYSTTLLGTLEVSSIHTRSIYYFFLRLCLEVIFCFAGGVLNF